MAVVAEIKGKIFQLNQTDFQILCDSCVYEENYTNIVPLGMMAGGAKFTPGTLDTHFSDKNGKYVFAEYTP